MLLHEPSASPRGRLVAGCMVAAAVQMVVALSLATAVPDAVTDPPAPLVLQIAVLPPSPASAIAIPAEATLRDFAPPDPAQLEPMPPAAAVPDTATALLEPSQIQSLAAPPQVLGLDAPRAAPAELPAAPAAPHRTPRTARPADPVRPPIRAVLHRTPLQPGPQAGTVSSRAPAGDAPAAEPAPAAVPLAAPSRAGLDSYEGHLKSVIQAALRYPPAAAMMGRDGRARVAFSISDARAVDIRLLRGTGSSQLDEAALAAMRQAAYPRPPAEIGARSMAMLVWVEFSRPDAEE
jgi:protein TonB